MRRKLLAILTCLLTLVALSGAASACGGWLYQPELPEALRK